jgi:hypothetical protein
MKFQLSTFMEQERRRRMKAWKKERTEEKELLTHNPKISESIA